LEVAKQSYLDLGLTLNFANKQIAEFQVGAFRFLLPPFNVKEHSENFMMSLTVENAEGEWAHIEQSRFIQKYPSITVNLSTMQPFNRGFIAHQRHAKRVGHRNKERLVC
jgi:hypothetical protein